MAREKHSISCQNRFCPFYGRNPTIGEFTEKMESVPDDCPLKKDVELANKALSEIQNSFRKIVMPVPNFSYLFPAKEVLEEVAGITRVIESLRQNIFPVGKFITAQRDMWNGFTDALSLANQLKPVWEFSNILGDFFRKINAQVGQIQWGWADELFADDGNAAILAHLKNGNITEFEKNVLEFYSKESNMEKMKQEMFSEKLFSERKHLIDDALWAHSLGKYNLSLPTLLAQIEGVLWDFGEELHFVTGQTLTNRTDGSQIPVHGVTPVVREFDDNELDARVKFHLEYLLLPSVRNPIQHGRIKDYGTEINSVKAIIFLYALYYYIQKYRDANLQSGAAA